MRRYATELVGTLALVFTVGCAVLGDQPGVLPPIALGAVLAAVVLACAPVSGAHVNPAVTLAFVLRGRTPSSELLSYWAAQLIGGLLGAVAAHYVTDAHGTSPELHGREIVATLLGEALFAFLLVLVVLAVTTPEPLDVTRYALAVGLTVTAGAFALGTLAGGAFNPAVAVGAWVVGLVAGPSLWVFLVADVVGATAAALAFATLGADET